MELVFAMGGNLRRVFINGRKISFMVAENSWTPIEFDLDKLEDPKTKGAMKRLKVDKEIMRELALLKTEGDLRRDVIKDFQSNGWRLMKES